MTSQCQYKLSSFFDLTNAFKRLRLFSRNFQRFRFFFPGSACFLTLAPPPKFAKLIKMLWNFHRRRRSLDVFLIDRLICHGRYRQRPSIHLRGNTVDIDIIDCRSTYGQYQHRPSIHLPENTVDINIDRRRCTYGRYPDRRSTYFKIRSISISTVNPATGKYGPCPRSIRSIIVQN